MKLLDMNSYSVLLSLCVKPGLSLRDLLRAIMLSLIVIPETLVAYFKSRYYYDLCIHVCLIKVRQEYVGLFCHAFCIIIDNLHTG